MARLTSSVYSTEQGRNLISDTIGWLQAARMNVSSLMAARDHFLGVHPQQQSPPLAALHHMMETKIPRGPSPPLPTKSSSFQARAYQSARHHLSTPHRIHNILGCGAPPSLPDVAAGFAAAAAAAAGLVVDHGPVCPGYSPVARPPPAAAAPDCRAPGAPATAPFWSTQTTAESSVSSAADWNHAVTGAYRIES